ncbi:RES domain-containing protein [Pseudarcicella hirudinis]|uniref:RES domain-containing protein n=1 Tax=Pseudarcicella hirudinis TaxID=1079859 RepID=A0A1I5USN2_9BACT|nr:RES family NAD+ phosphorylase [Pseudarcicella hirudinis]SFP98202.1 RES domain-containing protein [Pseudarcicella hirudinis]
MQVFRITKEQWAGNLRGSGFAARWNSNGVFMCYSASSRALACLEMVVHLTGDRLASPFKITVIDIPDEVAIKKINPAYLPADWTDFRQYDVCQAIGDDWIKSFETCILQVPSAIIKNEYNFLINSQHQDFQKIKVVEIEDFTFDSRLKD